MRTYPIPSISVDEALEKQFKLVDEMTKVFKSEEILSRGDLGVVQPQNMPLTTQKTEQVIAGFFNAEDAMLVRGSGTAAIQKAIFSIERIKNKILVHDAPVYPTTATSLSMLEIESVSLDFNEIENMDFQLVKETVDNVDSILIQYTRQKPDDRYDIEKVINFFKRNFPEKRIVTDDNYAVMKVNKIGTECGADLSCFSTFKLLGPEGIGCIVGKSDLISKLRKQNYSGGSQVQGHEALDVLKGLVYAPVALANQARTIEKVIKKIKDEHIEGIKDAYIANAQSKILLIEFEKPVAKEFLKKAQEFGSANHPVGAESQYEIVPMFYRVSGTFREFDPKLDDNTIRINPYRSGPETVLRIIMKTLEEIGE
ncbi:aminotransferase class V-fold PLP-dependent enzyme [Lactobacillus sp. YT155]|uniref:aminotransferase class V-fold PLP-dependent enzyme n=1 Tax=Lactobacillus sp. YT155 TaxID=3060955 RepID=UPI00265F1733|nr:aminotransferase class V-fold PLP-dependent enzyme [Lactobacillus sp. YT155]MDO1604947.1 aminotransferase class V-fold PLP-dependent enzyme [Lactobacillus sp. YT155]